MIENPFERFLGDGGVVILDGALATELEQRGANLNDALWSARILLEDPDLIRQVHYDYLVAGADVITTASYQATFEGFARRGLDHEQAAELMRLSVRLALEARDAFWAEPANRAGRVRPLVAASVGPYGAYLADGSEYRGDYGLSVAELMDFHRPRMAVLAAMRGGPAGMRDAPMPGRRGSTRGAPGRVSGYAGLALLQLPQWRGGFGRRAVCRLRRAG